MNYLAEIKAFYDRLELNPQPNTVIALWHALMSIANKAGWPDTFTVASSVLGLRSGLNASALKRARNKLATDGFIEWKARGGNLSAQYKIKSLVVQNYYKNEPQSEPQSEPQNEPQCEPQSEPINKQRHKQKHNTPPISPWSSLRNLPQPIQSGVLAILLKQNTAMRYWLVYRKMIWYWQHRIMQIHAGGRKQQSDISKSRRTGFAKIYLCNT